MKRLLCLTLSVIILLTVVPLVPSSFAASDWSDWVSELPSGDYEYETKTQYRYRDKIVTGTQWKKTGSGSEEYVKAWPPGFDRSHSYYSRFNKTISNWETSTSKRVYEDEHEIWYIYWHWVYPLSGYHTAGNRLISDTYNDWIPGGGYATIFEATIRMDPLTWDSSAGAYKCNLAGYDYSYWWLSWSITDNRQLPIYRSYYTDYEKENVYGWSDWSSWQDSYVSSSSSRDVETRTLYRYRDNIKTYSFDVNIDLDGNAYNGGINGVTFDVYFNDSILRNDVEDCYEASVAEGTYYWIDDVTVNGCYKLNGSNSYSGTVTGSTVITIPIVTSHTWNSGVVTKEPTTTENGEKTYTCLNCGTTKVEPVGKKNTYTIKYDANGGTGAPSSQTKTQGKALSLSSTKPTKSFKITYNANGGKVSSASKSVSCTFKNWNTAKNGSGTSYTPGASYTKDGDVTLYAQWMNPKAGTLATPTHSGYTFDGWYTAASGGTKITADSTITANTTIYAHWKKNSSFNWGTDNWNFLNNDDTGDFSSGTYRNQIDENYLNTLKKNLTNEEYQTVFLGYDFQKAWLDEKFGGSCYGMSSTALLAKKGLLPFVKYQSGAKCLHDLKKPTKNKDVSSLITYYQMLQVKDVIQQQYRSVPAKTNESNIKQIIELLNSSPTVLLGFKKNGWGGHSILAYGYEYGSYTWNGISYQGCIKICDPNASISYNEKCNIYFNTKTFNWAIPAYSTYGISSSNGAAFNYIGAAVNEINEGGYLSGSPTNKGSNYIARIDATAIADNRIVSKVQKNASGNYLTMNTAPDDIIEDYSYISGNASKGTIGYNLKDSTAAYTITQSDPVKMQLTMDYKDCFLTGSSAAGQSITFDKTGYVEVNGESAAFSMSMTFNSDHPTDWFSVQVKGNGSDKASLKKVKDGYIISADNLTKTEVKANNRTNSAKIQFSTKYKSALIYEVNKTTIGIKLDTDNNGTYETVLNTNNTNNKLGDVDGNGKVESADARLALRASVKLENYKSGSVKFIAADVDKNGKIESSDARLILRASVKLEDPTKW